MSKDWIVVADKNRCRIFEQANRHGALEEIADLVAPTTRLKNQDINTDRHGRAFDSGGQGRHAMGSSVEPVEQEAIRFAKEVAAKLDSGRQQNSFGKLYVIAEPRFLGYLRQNYSRPLKEMIAAEIDKDWTMQPPDEIRTRLREAVFGG
ncbi:MAG TPA: host attachment protein [Gammaproteobacteria bacterium]